MSTPCWGRWDGKTLLCRVRLAPRSGRDELIFDADRLRLRLTSPPLNGRANAHALRLLAELFGVPRRRVKLLGGEKSRDKLFAIEDPQRIPVSLRLHMPQRREE